MESIIENATQPTDATPLILESHSVSKPFIEANTISATFEEIREKHIIPVFVKDNEPLISHAEFIEATCEIAQQAFEGEVMALPEVRVSHPIKGRIPDAKDKPAQDLYEWEKTLYYERMAFIVEIPSIRDTIDGNTLALTIGGVKAYSMDNLHSRSLSEQHFKVFIGFKNRVCTNLCVWTDGYMEDVRVKNVNQLRSAIRSLIDGYNATSHLNQMRQLSQYSITESQFAHLVGRCRMYNHLPAEHKAKIPPLLFGDQQIGAVVKDFYRDHSFCKDGNGEINLWRLYNLFTGANKSTYIDAFLDRSVNAFQLTEQIFQSVATGASSWYTR